MSPSKVKFSSGDLSLFADYDILITIKDVTSLLHYHLKFVDHMYRDAMEANFSHEYMSPLSSIINNSKLCKNFLIDLVPTLEESKEASSDVAQEQLANIQTVHSLVKATQQAGILMHYYNQNVIQCMKIKKSEFTTSPTW